MFILFPHLGLNPIDSSLLQDVGNGFANDYSHFIVDSFVPLGTNCVVMRILGCIFFENYFRTLHDSYELMEPCIIYILLPFNASIWWSVYIVL